MISETCAYTWYIIQMAPGTLVKYYSKVTLKSFFGMIISINEGAGANDHQYYWVLTQVGVKNCYDENLTRIL